jgi:prepilin-type N-terminal cleavage/methylation domain-containing protein
MKRTRKTQKGFTLPELMISIFAGSIIMLTATSLSSISTTKWGQGNTLKEMSMELAMSINSIASEVKMAHIDTVTVSSTNDTLKVGSEIKYYQDGSNNLVLERNGNTFEFLEGMVTNFTVETPVVGASGDTLNTISVTLVTDYNTVHDSTNVWLTPRLE